MRPPLSGTARLPLYGGDITRYNDYLHQQIRARAHDFSDQSIRSLIMNYGTQYAHVIDEISLSKRASEPEQLSLLRAQIRYAVREEMAFKLSDVIFRRTELGSAGYPGSDLVRFQRAMYGG